MRAKLFPVLLLPIGWSAGALAQPVGPASATLDAVVITATGRPEPRSRITGTVQVIEGERITRSTARSVTDLLAENAVGFFSEWTPAQTSINIRGGATDGQGRDFRSQVLVLMNGRRAGTANLSKLSPADVERIEIVRGPASVIYGSGAIGGVINIITRNGRNSPGGVAEVELGSWELVQGRARHGGALDGIDWYLGAHAGQRGNYHSGQGGTVMINTDWERRGATGAFGWQLNEFNRFDVTLRTDGIYDAGFRGSGSNTINREDRTNASAEIVYSGRLPDGFARWTWHSYLVNDRDVFRWASPVIRNAAGLPAPGSRLDYNRRELDIAGTRVQPVLNLFEGNELLLGFDAERSWLRSTRDQLGPTGAPVLIAPMDNNQTETVTSFYAENSQRLFEDRLVLRGGIRYTAGTTSFDPTPNLALQRPGTNDYTATTYTIGATWRATEMLSFRTGLSTGFRAPTASELGADFTALGGGRTFGNPGLEPETSRQVEVGATLAGAGWSIDVALFNNVIMDRIITRARPGVANTSDWINNPGDVEVSGIELQSSLDVLRTFAIADHGWRWSIFGNGYYNFSMRDNGVAATANTDRVERMYQYQAAIGTRFGQQSGVDIPWVVSLTGVLRGPMWYNTEENLLVPLAEANREFIHRKSPFWVFNARLDATIRPDFTVFAAVNNIFDVNEHPIFIGIDRQPYLFDARFSNGGFGTSMPGREFVIGAQIRF